MQRARAELLREAARLLHAAAAPPAAEPLVSARVAQLVSLRGAPIVELPADVRAAIEGAAAGVDRRTVRRRGAALSDRLQRSARSRHRGGEGPNLREALAAAAAPPPRPPRGKARQAERRALLGAARLPAAAVEGDAPPEGLLAAVAAAAAAAPDAEGAQAWSPAPSGGAGASPQGEAMAVAYAAARLPGTYAALRAVLAEAAATAPPGWRPASVLDFGAGPGTAALAARAVWPPAPGAPPLVVSAVEPAAGMAWVGHEIAMRLGAAEAAAAAAAAAAAPAVSAGGAGALDLAYAPPSAPVLRWAARLPPRGRGRAPPRRHDLVVAAYVLGELRSDAERARAVDDLWARAGRFLVLVEPGTPAGAARILAARARVLARRAGGAPEARAAAPCAHDGACPLAGRASWCHFAQRFRRPPLLRAAAAARAAPGRDHQDERFSYVVLARGARGALPGVRAAAAAPPRARAAAGSDADESGAESDEEAAAAAAGEARFGDDSPAAEAAARAAAAGWPRLVRPPRKRGGHVILDLCAPADAAGGAGALMREVVARSRGAAAYRLARAARWGDVWPLDWTAPPPPAAAAGEESEEELEEEECSEGEEYEDSDAEEER
jgi:ribosomal protein RSM22 (predicted rRNA methylase)